MTPHRFALRRERPLDGVKARVIAAALVVVAAVVASCGVEGQGQVGGEPESGLGPVATLLPSPQAGSSLTPNATALANAPQLDPTAALIATATAIAIANPIPPYNPRDPNLVTPEPTPFGYVPGTPWPTVVRGLPTDPPADYFSAVMPTPILSQPSDPTPPPFPIGTPPFKPGDASWEQGRKIYDPSKELQDQYWSMYNAWPDESRVKLDEDTFAILHPGRKNHTAEFSGTYSVGVYHPRTGGWMYIAESGQVVSRGHSANVRLNINDESADQRFDRLMASAASMARVTGLFNDSAKAAELAHQGIKYP